MSRYPFSSYPNGWYQVGWSADLEPGGVRPLQYFGQDLVLFRTAGGEAVVFDAHCPHLGAHLGHGGCVLGAFRSADAATSPLPRLRGAAIRLLASTITGGGRIEALGGAVPCCQGGNAGTTGSIRMEPFVNTFGTNLAPAAARLPSPGPVSNPVNPTVAITGVEGVPPPANPQGYRGQVDLIVSEPGPVQIDLRTTDVPAGTDVEVSVKPKLADPPIVQRLTLVPGDCVSGVCNTLMSVDLNPGSYIVEARATFEAP